MLQNQAQLKNAQVDVQRYRDLYAQDSNAKQTLDTAEAGVAVLGTVKTNQGAVDDAKLNLEFTKIRAPSAAASVCASLTSATWPGQRHYRPRGDHPDPVNQRGLH